MDSSVWLVPVGAAPVTIRQVEEVLRSHTMSYQILDRPWVRYRSAGEELSIGILCGGVLQPTVPEILRSLSDAGVPTLVLIEQLTDHHEGLLLGGGAFDVVGLPVSQARLASRIAALHRNASLRRPTAHQTAEHVAVAGGLSIWPARREVRLGSASIELTKTEFDLLLALAVRPDEVLTRHELGDSLTGKAISPRALESHLSRLRLKVVQAGGPRLVEPVRGIGYRLSRPRSVAPGIVAASHPTVEMGQGMG